MTCKELKNVAEGSRCLLNKMLRFMTHQHYNNNQVAMQTMPFVYTVLPELSYLRKFYTCFILLFVYAFKYLYIIHILLFHILFIYLFSVWGMQAEVRGQLAGVFSSIM